MSMDLSAAEQLAQLERRVARERLARQEAESIAERVTTDLYESLRATHRFKEILHATPDVVAVFQPDGKLLDLNRAGRAVLGLGESDSIANLRVDRLTSPEHRGALRSAMASALEGGWDGELSFQRHDGHEIPVSAVMVAHRGHDERVEYVSVIARDLTERKVYEAELHYRAFFDQLTGLPAQESFLRHVQQGLARSLGALDRLSVLALDVADYRTVNETLGREAGNRLLAAVADRLHGVLGSAHLLARIGAGEFAILVEDLDRDQTEQLCIRLVDALRRPFVVEGRQLVARAAIGVVFCRGDRDRPENLLRDAEAALARAIESGADRYEIFDDAMRMRAVERLEMEHDLRRALQRDELVLHYQPEIDLRTGELAGVEALVRWNHPLRGLIPPGTFIGLAEDTGLIVGLGQWVLEQAAAQLKAFHDARPDRAPMFVSANLSPRQLFATDLVRVVERILEISGADPSSLLIEMTENVFAGTDDRTLSVLRNLHSLGVKLVVDDFGAGHSSLRYVKSFPIDVVKIDRVFISNLEHDPADRAVVKAIIDMVHALDLTVVAEGVEEAPQAEILTEMGCDLVQGYYFGRPVPVADLQL